MKHVVMALVLTVLAACAPSTNNPGRGFTYTATKSQVAAAILNAGSKTRPNPFYTPYIPISQTETSLVLEARGTNTDIKVTMFWTLSEPAMGQTRVNVNTTANTTLILNLRANEDAIIAELDAQFRRVTPP